jgi:L-threonylcarbamoyladenylate synthase
MTHSPLQEGGARRLRACLARGGVAVFPTDTVYGLACDPLSRTAVERLFEIKGRRPERPAAVMFFALEDAMRALPGLTDRERAAVTALLPGPVTLLLANRERRFPLACAPDADTIGLRVPRLAGSLSELAGVGVPVLQSSANFSGQHEARRLSELPRELSEQADLVLDGGQLPGTASTVVDLRHFGDTGAWTVLREGALAIAAVEQRLLLAS